jgi:predicted Fe-Mo cluster-binding NifX family protein
MRVAIASSDKKESSQVSPVGARAEYYLIFENKKLVKTIKNPFAVGGGGAGFAVAQTMADEKVDLFVCGRVGPNMQTALETKGIKLKLISGKTVKETLKQIK